MPWFRVDDSLDTHHKAIAAGNEALGLWVRCGAYAARHLTDGFIPESIALLYGSRALADTLVAAKLWRRAKGGWQMHDYLDRNPSREEVAGLRAKRADAGRKGGVASGKTRSKTQANASASASRLLEPPSHPITASPQPPEPGGSGGHPPPGDHPGQPKHCRACGTSPRGQPPPPPPSDAARHPSARPIGEAVLAAGLTPSGTPSRGDPVHRLAAQARQAITREHE